MAVMAWVEGEDFSSFLNEILRQSLGVFRLVRWTHKNGSKKFARGEVWTVEISFAK